MMDALERLLNGFHPSGVYRFGEPVAARDVMERVARRGWIGWHLLGRSIYDKKSFLNACAQAMRFPAYFGYNWDALEECITDLSWHTATGFVLLYDEPAHFANNQPDQWQIGLEILHQAAAEWRRRETPFFVLLRKTRGVAPETPFLSRA